MFNWKHSNHQVSNFSCLRKNVHHQHITLPEEHANEVAWPKNRENDELNYEECHACKQDMYLIYICLHEFFKYMSKSTE